MNTAVAIEPSNTVPSVVSPVREIPLRNIQESKTNPRRQFDEVKLAELAGFVPGNKTGVMFRIKLCGLREATAGRIWSIDLANQSLEAVWLFDCYCHQMI